MDIENYPVPDHPELQRRRDVTDIQVDRSDEDEGAWVGRAVPFEAPPLPADIHCSGLNEQVVAFVRPSKAVPGSVSAMYSP